MEIKRKGKYPLRRLLFKTDEGFTYFFSHIENLVILNDKGKCKFVDNTLNGEVCRAKIISVRYGPKPFDPKEERHNPVTLSFQEYRKLKEPEELEVTRIFRPVY